MIANAIISTLIEKEDIPDLVFPDDETLESAEKIAQRRVDIERGLLLGNGFTSKVAIYFIDSEKLRRVETTIWEVTNASVVLKNNICIPIHRIVKVEIQNESLKYPNI